MLKWHLHWPGSLALAQGPLHFATRCSVADGTLSMDEARQRHQQLLKRQHFGRGVWRDRGLGVAALSW